MKKRLESELQSVLMAIDDSNWIDRTELELMVGWKWKWKEEEEEEWIEIEIQTEDEEMMKMLKKKLHLRLVLYSAEPAMDSTLINSSQSIQEIR